MKSASITRALVTASFLGLAALAPAADRLPDADASYLRAGALFDAGMKAVEAGRMDTAIGNLKSAQALQSVDDDQEVVTSR